LTPLQAITEVTARKGSDELAEEIAEDLQAAMELFASISAELKQ
jgi:hypothetical protein